jgi:hypothetical protein
MREGTILAGSGSIQALVLPPRKYLTSAGYHPIVDRDCLICYVPAIVVAAISSLFAGLQPFFQTKQSILCHERRYFRVHSVAARVVLAGLSISCLQSPVHGQVAVRGQGFVPYSDEPIKYLSDDIHDPVANLQQRMNRGEVNLEYEAKRGYLRSVLNNLAIPANSQTLVFSKTSFQFRKISPQTPRALYFNDDVYVGWVQDGKAVEVVSFDPQQGAIFYLLDEKQVEHPVFQRAELDCTQCHVAKATRDVPGVLLRSVFTNPSGTQASDAESFTTGQESPLKERWGGWYVTGTLGAQPHMGNVFSQKIDTDPYLNGESDVVAHLVLAHQTQMHNLITLTNYKTRLALHAAGEAHTLSEEVRQQFQGPAEELLRYLLFANEAPLTDQVRGSTAFATEFAARGPRDPSGRSLRDFDLRTRIFKYPCSYLIYSESFDSLPEPAKSYIYGRLLDVLTGRDQSPDFAKLTAQSRRAILEILLATKPNLPTEWRIYAKQAPLNPPNTLTQRKSRKEQYQ